MKSYWFVQRIVGLGTYRHRRHQRVVIEDRSVTPEWPRVVDLLHRSYGEGKLMVQLAKTHIYPEKMLLAIKWWMFVWVIWTQLPEWEIYTVIWLLEVNSWTSPQCSQLY